MILAATRAHRLGTQRSVAGASSGDDLLSSPASSAFGSLDGATLFLGFDNIPGIAPGTSDLVLALPEGAPLVSTARTRSTARRSSPGPRSPEACSSSTSSPRGRGPCSTSSPAPPRRRFRGFRFFRSRAEPGRPPSHPNAGRARAPRERPGEEACPSDRGGRACAATPGRSCCQLQPENVPGRLPAGSSRRPPVMTLFTVVPEAILPGRKVVPPPSPAAPLRPPRPQACSLGLTSPAQHVSGLTSPVSR